MSRSFFFLRAGIGASEPSDVGGRFFEPSTGSTISISSLVRFNSKAEGSWAGDWSVKVWWRLRKRARKVLGRGPSRSDLI